MQPERGNEKVISRELKQPSKRGKRHSDRQRIISRICNDDSNQEPRGKDRASGHIDSAKTRRQGKGRKQEAAVTKGKIGRSHKPDVCIDRKSSDSR